MKERNYITKAEDNGGEFVVLTYAEGQKVMVKRADWVRATGAIVNASYEDVVRDFAVPTRP